VQEVKIHTPFIKLNQFLKWVRAAETGSMANHMIQEGLVKVNDEVEIRRGRKISPGDRIEVSGVGMYLVTEEGSAEVDPEGPVDA